MSGRPLEKKISLSILHPTSKRRFSGLTAFLWLIYDFFPLSKRLIPKFRKGAGMRSFHEAFLPFNSNVHHWVQNSDIYCEFSWNFQHSCSLLKGFYISVLFFYRSRKRIYNSWDLLSFYVSKTFVEIPTYCLQYYPISPQPILHPLHPPNSNNSDMYELYVF